MPSKSPSKSKPTTKPEKADPRARQLQWARILVGIFAVLVILSMVLSSVALGN